MKNLAISLLTLCLLVVARPAVAYVVHLTFDDGPEEGATDQILDTLKEEKLKATFFLSLDRLSFLIRKSPEHWTAEDKHYLQLVQRMAREGHILANHSFAHISHTDMANSDEVVLKNLEKSYEVWKALKLPQPAPFRFPFGHGWFYHPDPREFARKKLVNDWVTSHGFYTVHWDVDTWDWSHVKRGKIPDSLLIQVENHRGGIILAHATESYTAHHLKKLIWSLQRSGHEFVDLETALQVAKSEQWLSIRPTVLGYESQCPGVKISILDQVAADCGSLRLQWQREQ